MPQAYRQEYTTGPTPPQRPAAARGRFRDRIPVQENMGLTDRMVRFVIGVLLTAPVIYAVFEFEAVTWEFFTSIAACYLLLTAMLGWDPFYAMFNRKTCDVAGGTACGSIPYQIKDAKGEHPVQDEAYKATPLPPKAKVEPSSDSGNTL